MEEKGEEMAVERDGEGNGVGPRFSLSVTMEVSTSRMKNGLRHALYQRFAYFSSPIIGRNVFP